MIKNKNKNKNKNICCAIKLIIIIFFAIGLCNYPGKSIYADTHPTTKQNDTNDKMAKFIDDVKNQAIKQGMTTSKQIQDLINKISKTKGITLSKDQINQFTSLLKKISNLNAELKNQQKQLNSFSQSITKGINTTNGIIGNVQSGLNNVKSFLNGFIKGANDQLEKLLKALPNIK